MIKQEISRVFRETLTRISPKLNTRVLYRIKFGKTLDLKNPQTLNEKLLWLKFNTYWKNPLIKQCADKYKVREYIKKTGCNEILNELLAVYEYVDDIEWEKLPKQFVIKLNVGCGCNLIVRDKSKLNIVQAKKTLKRWMRKKHYLGYSEMQYKDVKPYLLVEKFIKPQNGSLPDDYKFYCFGGKAPYVMMCVDRHDDGHDAKYLYFNEAWEMQMMSSDAIKYGATLDVPKPDGIDRAFEYAKKLSKDFPFVRVDLYIVDGNVIFGELTFTPGGAMDQERLPETDKILGELLDISTLK